MVFGILSIITYLISRDEVWDLSFDWMPGVGPVPNWSRADAVCKGIASNAHVIDEKFLTTLKQRKCSKQPQQNYEYRRHKLGWYGLFLFIALFQNGNIPKVSICLGMK